MRQPSKPATVGHVLTTDRWSRTSPADRLEGAADDDFFALVEQDPSGIDDTAKPSRPAAVAVYALLCGEGVGTRIALCDLVDKTTLSETELREAVETLERIGVVKRRRPDDDTPPDTPPSPGPPGLAIVDRQGNGFRSYEAFVLAEAA